MPLDPNIILSQRPVEAPDPVAIQSRIYGLQQQQQQTQENGRAIAARSALADLMRTTPKVDDNGVQLWDVQALTDGMAARGLGPEAEAAATHLNAINQGFQQQRATQLALMKQGAESVAAAGNDPELAGHFLDQLEVNHTYPKAQLQSFREFINANPDQNVAKLTAYMMGPQKLENAAPGTVSKNPITGQIIPNSQVPNVQKTRAELASDAADPTSPTQARSAAALKLDRPEAGSTPPTLGSPADYLARYAKEHGLDPAALTTAQVNAALKQHTDATQKTPVAPPSSALSDVKEAVAGMKDGTLPPQLPGRATKEYLATMAEAHRQGYDLQAAVTDWNATQKHIATLNGAQQLRLNQSINALPDLLDTVDTLASQWKGGRFPLLNSANLKLAKGGAYGPDVAAVATQLDAQIADVTADLGTVYMGGNTPTEQALALSGKALKGEWNEKVLHAMVALARKNVTIRRNSINTTGVQGASDQNPYVKPNGGKPDPLGIR